MLTQLILSSALAALPDIPASSFDATYDGDGDDRFGYQMASGDLNGDGHRDLVVAAPAPQAGNKVYVFFGPIDLSSQQALDASHADVVVEGDVGTETGWSIAVGDALGDATDDLVVGRPGSGAGAFDVYEGPLSSGATLSKLDAAVSVVGANLGDTLGWSLTVGDFDGDNKGEIGVGACNASPAGQSGIGVAYIFDVDGPNPPTGASQATTTISGVGRTGCAVDAADFNGDGFEDFIVGSHGDAANTGLTYGGSVAIVYGRPSFAATYSLMNAVFTWQDIALIAASSGDGNNLGFDLASYDLDQDGHEDLIIGAPASTCVTGINTPCLIHDDYGRVYVVRGAPDRGPTPGARPLAGVSPIDQVFDYGWQSDHRDTWLGYAVHAGGFAGVTYSSLGGSTLGHPNYGRVVLAGTRDSEAFSLVYGDTHLVRSGPIYECEYDGEELRCSLVYDPEAPRGIMLTVELMNFAGHRFVGDPDEQFGFDVHVADLDDDGIDDLNFGATGQLTFEDPSVQGKIYLFRGK